MLEELDCVDKSKKNTEQLVKYFRYDWSLLLINKTSSELWEMGYKN